MLLKKQELGPLKVVWEIEHTNGKTVEVNCATIYYEDSVMYGFNKILRERTVTTSSCLPNWIKPRYQVKLLDLASKTYSLFLDNKLPEEL